MITYSHVELPSSIPTKVDYAPGESRERVNSFSARTGWTITREGDVVTVRKGDEVAEFPWCRCVVAIPMPAAKGEEKRK